MAEFSRFFVILQKILSFCAMSSIKINGKRFRVSIPEAEIKRRVKELAGQPPT